MADRRRPEPVNLDELPWDEQMRIRREVWQHKPLLAEIYGDWFDRIRSRTVPGRTLEIGGGSGFFKRRWPELLSSDIVGAPWLDLQADCLALPIRGGALDNVVGVDVLHHLADPDQALGELARVVRPGGRGVFVEPFVSPLSGRVRGRYHQEQQDLTRERLYDGPKRPDESNLALPTLLFWRNRAQFAQRFPRWRVQRVERFENLVYALTGGFSRPSLVPEPVLRLMHGLRPLAKPLTPLMAFKMLIVLERTAEDGRA